MLDIVHLTFQSHAGSIEALRFQGVIGLRKRELPSEPHFAFMIVSIAWFVKGCGFLHRSWDDGRSAEAFSETQDQTHMEGSFRIERGSNGLGWGEKRGFRRDHWITLPRTPGGRIFHGGPRKVSAPAERKVNSQVPGPG